MLGSHLFFSSLSWWNERSKKLITEIWNTVLFERTKIIKNIFKYQTKEYIHCAKNIYNFFNLHAKTLLESFLSWKRQYEIFNSFVLKVAIFSSRYYYANLKKLNTYAFFSSSSCKKSYKDSKFCLKAHLRNLYKFFFLKLSFCERASEIRANSIRGRDSETFFRSKKKCVWETHKYEKLIFSIVCSPVSRRTDFNENKQSVFYLNSELDFNNLSNFITETLYTITYLSQIRYFSNHITSNKPSNLKCYK